MSESILNKTVKIKFIKGPSVSPTIGNIWVGRVVDVPKKEAKQFISLGHAELVLSDKELKKAAAAKAAIEKEEADKVAAKAEADKKAADKAAKKEAAEKEEADKVAAKAAADKKAADKAATKAAEVKAAADKENGE